ncbi:hypothetical protein QGM71_10280 [Virgibacillus sp. C22-A2]|uniref:Uncharacterized protein n=1 Tax=Virgibacillus tibetensis TaxID=3042313 RepID=A0ABU6KEY4_9BACI|nr:hypothetical protein [Virgibacillus sp. C22-A2]
MRKKPYNVVEGFDLTDGEDPTTPPRFSYEQCGGEMYPKFYKGYMARNIIIGSSLAMEIYSCRKKSHSCIF